MNEAIQYVTRRYSVSAFQVLGDGPDPNGVICTGSNCGVSLRDPHLHDLEDPEYTTWVYQGNWIVTTVEEPQRRWVLGDEAFRRDFEVQS